MITPGLPAAKAAIRNRFSALWVVNGAPRTPIHWMNQEPFTPPQSAPWVRFSLMLGEGRRVSIGPRLDRWTGVVTIQVFTPKGIGDGSADALCEEVAAIFAPGVTLAAEGRVTFQTPTARVVPGSDNWFQNNVICPFQRDRTA